jgi:hypothetical protein
MENSSPFYAFQRSVQLLDWRQTILLGLLTVNLGLLLFIIPETPIWDTILQLFSWMAPPTEEGLQVFKNGANAIASVFFKHLVLVVQIISGGLLYFSCREVVEAKNLHQGIKAIGTHRKIRGLARE